MAETLFRVDGVIIVVLCIIGIGMHHYRGDSAYRDVSKLKETIDNQQRQIDELKRELEEMKRRLS